MRKTKIVLMSIFLIFTLNDKAFAQEKFNITECESRDYIYICDQFIDINFPNHAKDIDLIIDIIDEKKENSKSLRNKFRKLNTIYEITIILFSLTVVIVAAIANAYKDNARNVRIFYIKITLIPIILSAFITAGGSLSVFFKIKERAATYTSRVDLLARLQSDMIIDMQELARIKVRGTSNTLNEWEESMDAIYRKWYEEYGRILEID